MIIMRRLRRRKRRRRKRRRRKRRRTRRSRRKRRYKVLEGSYSAWLWYYWGTMRFELRLITQLALLCTGEFIDVLMFITSIFSITETHSPMQIKHIKKKIIETFTSTYHHHGGGNQCRPMWKRYWAKWKILPFCTFVPAPFSCRSILWLGSNVHSIFITF